MSEPDLLLQRAEELLARRRLDEAKAAFDQAERGGAEVDACAGGRWMCAALGGEFATAWEESDAIRARGAPDPHRYWRGEAVAGRRLMLRSLHGYGDAVQFLRYVPRLSAKVERLFVEVSPRLRELAMCLDGMQADNVEVLTWDDPQPTYEVQAEVVELPYLFRTEVTQLPGAAVYLRVPAEKVKAVGQEMGERVLPRVGVAWAAGEWNESRSVPVTLLEGVLRESGKEVWSLQGERRNGEAEALFAAGVMRDAAALGGGMVALAATIANLDAVVTVDTLAAHVAGAMGVPALVLLQAEADWRWMVGREDSPWYPSVRLLRCRPGEAVAEWMGRVPHALAELLKRGSGC